MVTEDAITGALTIMAGTRADATPATQLHHGTGNDAIVSFSFYLNGYSKIRFPIEDWNLQFHYSRYQRMPTLKVLRHGFAS